MSAGRPVDWAPLAGSDPIGGDVAAVSREARRYQDMATELRDQVARLKRIAAQDEMLGRTADKLREAAEDLSGKMADTVGRFERVGSALQEWVPHLEHAQDATLVALRRAQEAQHQQAVYAPPVVLGPPSPAPPTDEQMAAERRRVGLHEEAAADLHAARARFDDAVDEHHRQAHAIAARLDEAAHDQLTDSRWEQFKGWVHEHAETIKKIAEVLSWIATGLAVLALFIPGVNLIAILGYALAASVLVGHGILAASGEGAWTDVALDLLAVATMGMGVVAATGIRAAQQSTRLVAASAARRVAARQTRSFAGKLSRLQRQATGARGIRAERLWEEVRTIKAARPLRPVAAARAVLKADLPDLPAAGLGRALSGIRAGGDLDNLQHVANITGWTSTFGSRAVQSAAAHVNVSLDMAQANYAIATAVDAWDKVFGSSDIFPNKPAWSRYVSLKESWSLEWGSPW